MKKISLPHPELVQALLKQIKITARVNHSLDKNTGISYEIYSYSGPNDPVAFYNESGNIYVTETLHRTFPQYADLVAYHETEEIKFKRGGNAHGEAHVKAWLSELSLVNKIYSTETELKNYIDWRISIYSQGKIPHKEVVAKQLMVLLLKNPHPSLEISEFIKNNGL